MRKISDIKGQKKRSSLISGMYKETSYTETEKGALTFSRTNSSLLDFYALVGAMRDNQSDALDLFKKAFAENRLLAIRILFYLRDVRGGQGERKTFRNCIQFIGETYPEIFEKVIQYIPKYGRWDDMFFENDKVFELLKEQLRIDLKSDTPSLLAKWLPTINASSPSTKAKANLIADKIGMDRVTYRKTIRDIRKRLRIVEELMSANRWDKINYSSVPSQASRIYRNAFKRHDEKRYSEFIEQAEKGDVKINASTLYPYQIYNTVKKDYSRTLEALWNQLPDYTQGNNALVMADVSGSMIGDPMSVSVSLALYFAERNKGLFKDYFMTFSSKPTLQKVVGVNLRDKMNSIESAEWGFSTNLQKGFDLILDTAINNNVNAEDMPTTLYIISDMEFDSATKSARRATNFDAIKEKYRKAGYEMPTLVFWNVNARQKNLPVQEDERGVALVSGLSPVIFKLAVENKTPEQVMLDTINTDRYKAITI